MNDRHAKSRHDWLNLIDVSGPFLAVPVLEVAFPQGLEGLDTHQARRLRGAYDEWRDAIDTDDVDLEAVHHAWVAEVLDTALEMDPAILRRGDAIPDVLRVTLPERAVTLTPDVVLTDRANGDAPLLLVHVLDPDVDLEATGRFEGLAVTPAERMVTMLRGADCPVGLVTNGEQWMLVHAPVGSVVSFASWYARLWGQEPETLRAFVSLLGVRRFFGPADDRLPALHERSLKHQDDVTAALGEQVRRAVEVLVQSVDRADQDRNRVLLRDTEPRELYEAALTVMMRLVFLLAAEERGLLLLNDPRYDANYALSTLRMQLRAEPEEVLERRRSAWSRLLALFRAVYGGIDHPALALPALGGSLFDPDRYPFLEGRAQGTDWRTEAAEPLPIDDRTVLLLLEAIQTFEGRTLSYRALDVEQIGHVYEGLLERTVERVDDVTLELDSGAKAMDPRVALGELESVALDGRDAVEALLVERSERSASAVRNGLDRDADERLNARLLTVCGGDERLHERVVPYAHLLRTNPWGYPLVHRDGAFVVVLGSDRRETGAHYTPKSLTEKIVAETLTPLVYRGPAEGIPPEEWALRRPDELLDLKVCDPAMGSGAFLVQVCRFLSERLVEAWTGEEAEGHAVDVEGRVRTTGGAFEPLPTDAEERAVVARRLVAERCLYGVDLNPLAVELAKLSLWLTTLSKGRPFGFLDHHLKSGDSLLGIHDIRQLTELRIKPDGSHQLRLFGQSIEDAVKDAVELRQLIPTIPVRDIRDVEEVAGLEAKAHEKLRVTTALADAFIGTILVRGSEREKEARLNTLAVDADHMARGDERVLRDIELRAAADLSEDAISGKTRNPFHWPIEFPEVFQGKSGGFDAVIGNPPFLGGKKIANRLGVAYRTTIVELTAEGRKGAADLCAYFFLRASALLDPSSGFACLIATDSVADGDTGAIALKGLGSEIFWAVSSMPWPGTAGISVAIIGWTRKQWLGLRRLNGNLVINIQYDLTDSESKPAIIHNIKHSCADSFAGTYVNGEGFIINDQEAKVLIHTNSKNADVIKPYLTGSDVNTQVGSLPTRYVINFGTMSLEEASLYEECFQLVTDRVKPYRDTLTKQVHESDYWKFWDKRLSSYDKIRQFNRVLVASRATKHVILTWVSNGSVFSDRLAIFITQSSGVFASLQSSIHDKWAWDRCTGIFGSGISYAPSKAVVTFPLPANVSDLCDIGDRYYQSRSYYEINHKVCLTDLYNHFHSSENAHPQIAELRDLHRELDSAVASAYGWDDLDLGHGFHEVPYLPKSDRERFTMSEPARVEVLGRLSLLNRERYEEEVSQGLHEKHSSNGATRKKGTHTSARRIQETHVRQAGLDFGANSAGAPPTSGREPEGMILDYFRADPGWHSKSDVLAVVGLTASQWTATISELVARGLVERMGEKRGTRYRAAEQQEPEAE